MRRWSFVLFFALFAQPALAQSLDGLKGCARLIDDAARLACYDSQMAVIDREAAAQIEQRKKEAAIRAEEEKRLAAQRAAEEKKLAEERAAQAKLDAFGASNLPPERQPVQKADEMRELRAKVELVSFDPFGNAVLMLDNGQTWQQMELQKLPRIKIGDEVEINKGAIGGYRLTILRMNRTIPVRRRR